MILPLSSAARRCSPSSLYASPLALRVSASRGSVSILSVRRSTIRRMSSRLMSSIILRNSRYSSSYVVERGCSAMLTQRAVAA